MMKVKGIVFIVVMVSGTIVYGATPSFQGLGTLGGDESRAGAVSGDGSVVVGRSTNSSGVWMPFIWESRVMQSLPLVCGHQGEAWGVSDDGSVIVGQEIDTSNPNDSIVTALRWQNGLAGTLSGLNALHSYADGISANGSVVVGHCQFVNGEWEAFRWQNDVLETLGALGGATNNRSRAASADGSVVVGRSGNEAFRWENGVMQGLDSLGGGESNANDVSADGTVVVGTSTNLFGHNEAFRWTEVGGMVGLGSPPGFNTHDHYSYALAISSDGSIVVGDMWTGLGFDYRATIWDETNGMQLLQDVLTAGYGLDLSGWTLRETQDVAIDGDVITIVGVGYNPGGNIEAWTATIPEPATLSLLVIGGLALIRRRKSQA